MGAARELVDKKVIKSLVPLNKLSAVHLKEVTKKSVIEEVASGKFLFREGKRDSQTFYVLSGEVTLIQGKEIIGKIKGGSIQAKEPLANEQPRRVSARTSSKCTIMRIDTSLLSVMLDWDQSSQYEVTEIQSNQDEDWMTKMLKSDLFSHLPAQNIQHMIMRMQEVKFKAGQPVINQNEVGDCYYVIKEGHCVVSRQTSTDSKPVLIAELHDGDGFGEEALISEGTRNASVTMITKGVLMRLSKVDFTELLQSVLVTKVNFHEAAALAHEGAKWLDVQLPGESKERTVPGSLNIPLQALRESKDRLNSSDTYLAFCNDGYRSASAVFVLGQLGFDALLVEGGLQSVPNSELQALMPKSSTVVPIKSPIEAPTKAPPKKAEVEPKKAAPKKVAPAANNENASRKIIDELKNKARDSQSIENLIIDKKANQAQITKLEDELQRAHNIVLQQKSELAEVIEEKEKLNTQFSKLNDKVEGERSDQHTVDELLEQLEEMQYEHELERKQLEKEIQKHKKSTDKVSGVRTEIKELKNELKEQRVARIAAEKLVEETKKRISNKETESTSSTSKLEARIEQLINDVESQKELRTQIEDELKELKTTYSEESDTTSSKIKLVNDELSRGREEYRDLQQRLTDALSQKEALEREKLESDQMRTSLIEKQDGQSRESKETISRLTEEVDSLKNELASSRSLLESIGDSAQQESADKISEREKEFLENLQQQQDKVKSLEKQNVDLHELLKSSEKNIDKLKEQKIKIEFDWQAAEKARTGLVEQQNAATKRSQEKITAIEKRLADDAQVVATLKQKNEEVLAARDERINTLQAQNDEFKAQVDKLTLEIGESTSHFGENEKKLKSNNALLKDKADKQAVKLSEMKQLLEALENEKSSIEEAKFDLQKEKQESDANWSDKYEQQVSDFRAAKYRNDQLETELNIVKTDFEQGQKRVTELEDERSELIDQNQRITQRHATNSESSSEELKAAHGELEALELKLKKERVNSKEKIGDLEDGITELEQEINKYSELQEILEEKNQEIEEELTQLKEVQGESASFEQEIYELKGKLAEAQSSGQGDGSQGELYIELQQEMVTLKTEYTDLQKKHREIENERRTVQRELERVLKESDKTGNSKIKELSKLNIRHEKDIEELKTDLALAKSAATESESRVKGTQKIIKDNERKLQQLTLELRQAQQSTDQSTVLREKIEEIKRDTKDQLKHYQYEYESMVQKGRDENRKLRMEVERLHKQLQSQMLGAQAAPAENVMPLDLPVSHDASVPLDIEDLGAHQQNSFDPSASGSFTVPDATPVPKTTRAPAAARVETQSDRMFGVADDGADIFGEPDNFSEPFSFTRIIIIVLILAVGAGSAYWFFELAPTMQREAKKNKERRLARAQEKPPVPAPDPLKRALSAKEKRAEARRLRLEKQRLKKAAAAAKAKERVKAVKLRPGKSFRDTLKDRTKGPLVVSLPGSSFYMGSKGGLDINEVPRHRVRIRRYAISRTEVTFAQYAKFAQASGRSLPSDKDWGKGTRPVINVSWNDAVAYAKWLSSQTGHIYRLPTEAEWEYAARAGSVTEYYWGNFSGKRKANCFDCGSSWDSLKTAPVARFKPNAFGLYDMLGNAMEWTLDCYHASYKGAPSNGSAWISGNCKTRVVRGGSYKSAVDSIRSASREHLSPNTVNSQIGFRVVREL